jgi:hypothetical protein
MKTLRVPKTKEDFWKGVYSFKERALVFSSAPWKWWIVRDPAPPAPKLDGVGRVISPGPRNRVGGAYLAAYRALARLVIQTKNLPTSRELVGWAGNSQAMRMLVDWGQENTWYEPPPPSGIALGNIGFGRQGSYHIRTFASADGYASKPIEVKVLALGLRVPIKIRAAEGFEVSRDGLRFHRETVVSNLGAISVPSNGLSRVKLTSKFYIRKSSRLWGVDFVLSEAGTKVAVPKFVKGKIHIESTPLKTFLNVALIGDPNFTHYRATGLDANETSPNLADSMSNALLGDSGERFNSGRGYGEGVLSADGIF